MTTQTPLSFESHPVPTDSASAETVVGTRNDYASDVWSFGVAAWEIWQTSGFVRPNKYFFINREEVRRVCGSC